MFTVVNAGGPASGSRRDELNAFTLQTTPLMQEIEEGEPINLDDCFPAAVERVAADARRVRGKRDVIPFWTKRR